MPEGILGLMLINFETSKYVNDIARESPWFKVLSVKVSNDDCWAKVLVWNPPKNGSDLSIYFVYLDRQMDAGLIQVWSEVYIHLLEWI